MRSEVRVLSGSPLKGMPYLLVETRVSGKASRMQRHVVLLILFSLYSRSVWASAEPCQKVDPSCIGTSQITPRGKIEFYRNYDLQTPRSSITKVVIIVHGVSRHFGNSFDRMMQVFANPATMASTLVIAPHFLAHAD